MEKANSLSFGIKLKSRAVCKLASSRLNPSRGAAIGAGFRCFLGRSERHSEDENEKNADRVYKTHAKRQMIFIVSYFKQYALSDPRVMLQMGIDHGIFGK